MDLVAILRDLWRSRLLVITAALLALLVGVSTGYRIGLPPSLESRQHEVGIASATALVDTPSSHVADLGGRTGTDVATLSARASLLASLVTSSPLKGEIARRAGVPLDRLVASPPATVGPAASPAPHVSGASIKASDPRAHVLRTDVPALESGTMPIITVDTQAPDQRQAARLANEAVSVLKAHVESVAALDRVPAARRVAVTQLGPARAATVSRGPRALYGFLIALGVFGLGCAAILGVSRLSTAWRRASDDERMATDAALLDWDAPEDDVFQEAAAFLDDRAVRP
ncbi:MAG TPA: hypothetical protein VGW14_05125 [Thermoleophilaceae bacterium]|nr:hypothetical protein [Thermoleophilaceae bacterium]